MFYLRFTNDYEKTQLTDGSPTTKTSCEPKCNRTKDGINYIAPKSETAMNIIFYVTYFISNQYNKVIECKCYRVEKVIYEPVLIKMSSTFCNIIL